MYSSKDFKFPTNLSKQLSADEIEAWNMYMTKENQGLLPTQFHHFYKQGDTIIYQEHIADLITIKTMVYNKLQRDEEKRKAEEEHKKNKGLGRQGGGGFYGNTFRYGGQ